MTEICVLLLSIAWQGGASDMSGRMRHWPNLMLSNSAICGCPIALQILDGVYFRSAQPAIVF